MDADIVEIWRIRLTGVTLGEEYLKLLSAGERVRAERFRFEEDRSRYIASHVAVRCILAKHAGCEARSLVFCEGANGKPELEGAAIHHNLTHSGDLALLAVSLGEPVGIDIEKTRFVPEALDIAGRMFSEPERRMLVEAPEQEQSDLFLRCWTAKEAVVKATGQGLSGALQSFDVTATLRSEDSVVDLPGVDKFPWVVRSLNPGADYFGAVARRNNVGRLEIRDWDAPAQATAGERS